MHGVIADDTISVRLDGVRDTIPVTGVDTPGRRTPRWSAKFDSVHAIIPCAMDSNGIRASQW